MKFFLVPMVALSLILAAVNYGLQDIEPPLDIVPAAVVQGGTALYSSPAYVIVTFPAPFADANYRAACTPISVTPDAFVDVRITAIHPDWVLVELRGVDTGVISCVAVHN